MVWKNIILETIIFSTALDTKVLLASFKHLKVHHTSESMFYHKNQTNSDTIQASIAVFHSSVAQVSDATARSSHVLHKTNLLLDLGAAPDHATAAAVIHPTFPIL